MKTLFSTLAAAAWLTTMATASVAEDKGKHSVVVELYTSQGCYSCPPADAFLGKLANRKNVLALSFHVDYWNYLGWRDPFSSAAATKRQRAYRWAMKLPYVYTPQMVIDGRLHGIGSRTFKIDGLIERSQAYKGPRLAVTLTKTAAGKVTFSIEPEKGKVTSANVMLVLYDKSRTTKIPRGENGGKTLTYHNVVREFRSVGTYRGGKLERTVSAQGTKGAMRYGAAILVQRGKTGPMLGSASVRLDARLSGSPK
jgi:hypothetical protein